MTDQSTISLDPKLRDDWNGFAQHLDVVGADVSDMETTKKHLQGYKKDNPDSKITDDHIPVAINEVNQLKHGNPIGTLTPDQSKYIQSGMTHAYKNNVNNLKYPVSGDHGTDLEGHVKANEKNIPVSVSPPGGTSPKPGVTPNPGITPPANVPPSSGEIPKPDYNNPKSRLDYVIQAKKKYGNFIGGRGDTLLHMNETPDTDEIPVKEAAIKAAKPLGIDPVLLYSSAMEEGMSGLFPDKEGKVTVGDEATKDYPVAGFANFGLDHFSDVYPELAKRGYLPKDFNYQKITLKNPENNEMVNTANFKTVADALQAKAAYVKMFKDDNEKYAKEKGIELSPKAQQFFALVSYNGGPGTYHKMLDYYKSKGLLKGDKFISVDPGRAIDPGKSFQKVAPRLKMADVLRKEGLF